MLTNLHNAHTVDPDNVSVGGWIAQRVLILAVAVVSLAPFILGYVEM